MSVWCVFWVENGAQFLERICFKYEDALEYATAMGSDHFGRYNIEMWEVE